MKFSELQRQLERDGWFIERTGKQQMYAHPKKPGKIPVEKHGPQAFLKGDFEFAYKYDIGSIFDYIGVLDAGQLAKRIGMNASLLRQYKSGHVKASDKQKEKIQAGLHSLGRELLSVRL